MKYGEELALRQRAEAAEATVTRLREAYLPGNWEKLQEIVKERDLLSERVRELEAALKEIRWAATEGDGTSTECHMAYLADDALRSRQETCDHAYCLMSACAKCFHVSGSELLSRGRSK